MNTTKTTAEQRRMGQSQQSGRTLIECGEENTTLRQGTSRAYQVGFKRGNLDILKVNRVGTIKKGKATKTNASPLARSRKVEVAFPLRFARYAGKAMSGQRNTICNGVKADRPERREG